MTQSQRPIGVFDSGVGGLTVVAELKRSLPGVPIVYLGDTARLPYGTKSRATVRKYTERNLRFLIDRGVSSVVVACNTASALALPELEAPLPVWGVVEPGAARAAELTRGRIGVIATEATIRSRAYEHAITRHVPDAHIVSEACPLFVPLVEEGWNRDPVTHEVARRYLEPLLKARIDTLVLGCTHYPLLRSVLEELVGPRVKLVDSAEAVARTVATERPQNDANETPPSPQDGTKERPSSDRFFVTDAGERFERIAKLILERETLQLDLVEVG